MYIVFPHLLPQPTTLTTSLLIHPLTHSLIHSLIRLTIWKDRDKTFKKTAFQVTSIVIDQSFKLLYPSNNFLPPHNKSFNHLHLFVRTSIFYPIYFFFHSPALPHIFISTHSTQSPFFKLFMSPNYSFTCSPNSCRPFHSRESDPIWSSTPACMQSDECTTWMSLMVIINSSIMVQGCSQENSFTAYYQLSPCTC
jgi:hypothetical protein